MSRILPCLVVVLLASSAVAQESSRKEFEDWCKANEGRWIGDVTWIADWPGLGKKGDKVTGYYEATITEDGNAMTFRFYGGAGSGTGIMFYDAGSKQIKGTFVTSGGTVFHNTVYRANGEWRRNTSGSNPDGSRIEGNAVIKVSDGGNRHTATGTTTIGGKKVADLHDVWRRVSK